MRTYYDYIEVNEVKSLVEFHYEFLVDEIILKEWFDEHGDTPDLSQEQEQLILDDIRRFEYQRPLQSAEQQHLATQFQRYTEPEVEEIWCECASISVDAVTEDYMCLVCGGRVE